jgi:hypothetical protein
VLDEVLHLPIGRTIEDGLAADLGDCLLNIDNQVAVSKWDTHLETPLPLNVTVSIPRYGYILLLIV